MDIEMSVEFKKGQNLLPKTGIRAAGSLHLEWKRCGQQNCRCANGKGLHGPYAMYHWRENRTQKKRYIPMHKVAETLIEIERCRNARDVVRALWRSIQQS